MKLHGVLLWSSALGLGTLLYLVFPSTLPYLLIVGVVLLHFAMHSMHSHGSAQAPSTTRYTSSTNKLPPQQPREPE